jgi:AcrR family transcriptional regulator
VALSLFLARGVRKTDLTEVAYQAGVARVTVYRYCGDKKGLLRSVCMRIAAIFQRAAEEHPTEDHVAEAPVAKGHGIDSSQDLDLRLNRLGQELSNLPKGNLLACLEETHRLYPDVYEEFRAVRQAAVDQIFQQALDMATREQMLREGINLEVLKAIFWAAVVGLLENPTLISSNVSLAEIFATVTEVFRHGILIPVPSGVSQNAAVPSVN